MNPVLDAIFGRSSCRDFSGEPLTDGQLGKIIDAALAAPSAMNLQPWHIVAVTDKAMLDEMDAYAMSDESMEYYRRIMDRGGKMFYNAPCAFVIAIDDSERAPLDAGIVSQNICLAAHSLGLGSCICGMMRIPLEGEKGAGFVARMRFPAGMKFGMSVLVGRPGSKPKVPHELDRAKATRVARAQ